VTIDLAVLLALFLFGVLGMVSGAVRQLAHLGGIAVGAVAARPLAQLVAPRVVARVHYPSLFVTIALIFALFFVLYVASVIVLRWLLPKVMPRGEQGALNRVGGLLLGAGKAAAIAFVGLSAIVFVEKPLSGLWPEFRREASASVGVKLARRFNLFAGLPQFSGLSRLVAASRDPQLAARLAEDPEFKALSRDPRIRSLVDDAAVQRALQSGDYTALLSSVKVMALLNDPRAAERLSRLARAAPKPVEQKQPEP
jgi:membrane protein required for colicin V production